MGVNQEMAKVVVAAVDIPRGTTVKAEQVKLKDVPKNLVHPHAITDLKDVVESTVVTPLMKDEDVLDAKVAKGPYGIAKAVKPGMRAMTIQTPSVAAGVAGFIMPGNHVDVLLTISGDNNGKSTATILKNIEVMAVDDRDEPKLTSGTKIDITQLRTVTLQVSPDDSQLLHLAQSAGVLHLSLRNPEDVLDATTRTAILADLPFPQFAPVKAVETPPPSIVETPPAKPVETPPAKPVETPKKFVYLYKAGPFAHVVEKHRSDGGPAVIEAPPAIENNRKEVDRLAAPLPEQLATLGR
jgi:pilus assembly protein CpaB